ncbi:hypothetical protein [Streptomyces griseocarneus]|uniref:hypothetical protein n=1 Tax=Streptomyces griseocarneus TaxID=51201 RepID=UPI00167D0415|nr:hypothetical protein [Streptomyces griseocarneus]MBZ6473216.1 hypothetical protein [Streptomyces griseocarneus]GHG60498.1 hypothetical protein GCM10018779_27860 [Streptomyces griseocarneus]
MSFSISALVFFGLILAMLIRSKSVGIGAATVAVLFGHYLSRTGAAAPIDQVVSAIGNAIPSL